MLIVEHRLNTLVSSQVMVVEVVGPAPATHLFLCSGLIRVDAAHTVERTGMINTLPEEPLPLSFVLPDNHRQYLSLTTGSGAPLTLISSIASAAFPIIDTSEHLLPKCREIRGAQVHQQGSHAVLVIYLHVNASDVQV